MKKSLARREFLKSSAGITALAGASALIPTTANAFTSADKASAKSTCAESRNRFNYFGPNKDVRSQYFKFLDKPATVLDFGLSNAENERAEALHKTLHIFDGEPEVGYYDGLLDDLQRSGCQSHCGSYTLDGFPHDLVNGLGKGEIRVRPEDWWARSTLESNIAFMHEMVKYKGDQMMICTII